MMRHPIIRCEGICKRYDVSGDWVIAPLNWEVQQGESCLLYGASGVGKSTLLALLGLLDQPTAGSYWFQGHDTTKMDASVHAKWRSKYMGFVFQDSFLLPQYTVLENLCLPLYYQGVSRKNAEQLSKNALETLNIGAIIHRYPYNISGGQKQRVAVLRALITKPSLLLADEPTGSLDASTADEVLKLLLEEKKKREMTLIMVTHDMRLRSFFQSSYTIQWGSVLCKSSD